MFRSFILTLILLVFSSAQNAAANIISSSGREMTYQYEAEFRTLIPSTDHKLYEAKDAAQFHAAHLFGLFHSNGYAADYAKSYYLNEGYAGNKFTKITRAQFVVKTNDLYVWVKYSAEGQMLVLNAVAEAWLKGRSSGRVDLPLLVDLPAVYKSQFPNLSYANKKWAKCTDKYYHSASDFSYFYNPFECPELGTAPIAQNVSFNVQALPSKNENFPLNKLLSANGNGQLVTAYFVFGYDHVPRHGTPKSEIEKDASWKLFKNLENLLVEQHGFTKVNSLSHFRDLVGKEINKINLQTDVVLSHNVQRRYYSSFVRQDADKIWVIRTALFDTTNKWGSNATRSFPKFWKEAWENGDFIYFGGHSGDGASLSLNPMLETIGQSGLDKIKFSNNKTQVAFFDSCSSYSYYVDMYSEKKKNNLHIMNYGLVSLFEAAPNTMSTLLDVLVSPQAKEVPWKNVLHKIEASHLEPVLGLLYSDPHAQLSRYKSRGMIPSFLLNVHAP